MSSDGQEFNSQNEAKLVDNNDVGLSVDGDTFKSQPVINVCSNEQQQQQPVQIKVCLFFVYVLFHIDIFEFFPMFAESKTNHNT